MKVLAKNRRATFDYALTDRLTAGIALHGAEVKSIKSGAASLKGSFIVIRGGEAYLTNAHVTPYLHSRNDSYEPLRDRKLLLHRRQIDTLIGAKQSGLSIIPTALLQEGPLVKLELGIGRGKKRYDKRETIKRRDTLRDIARRVK